MPRRTRFDSGPPAVIVMEKVEGVRLSSGLPRAAEEAGQYLRRFHQLGASQPFPGDHYQWEDFICW